MFESVQVAERYFRSSLLVLGDEFMRPHVDASFLLRRRIYRSRGGRFRTSAVGGKADSFGSLAELRFLAEGVEEVRALKIFETMFQNSRFRRINIAVGAARTNNSCAKLDGPDFFNTLSHEPTFTRSLAHCSYRPKSDLQ